MASALVTGGSSGIGLTIGRSGFAGLPGDEMIQPEDCAEAVRMCFRLSPRARVPQVVIERVGSSGKIA
ncbi:MAG TPA: hypothetical protein VFV62_11770 [Gaiellaceae bacterium]|nr:hypothetical protein [Gaiellaceae bacterium]